MIKINLLAGAKPQFESKPQAATPAAAAKAFQGKAFGASLLVAAIISGAIYLLWSHQITALNQRLEVEKREAARLAQIQAENQRYQQRLEELERRINAIQTLQSNRTGPVELMATLGSTVNHAKDLYLTAVDASGSRIFLQGVSTTEASIAEFIAALKSNGSFSDVQLRQYFESDRPSLVTFKFNIDCAYQPNATVTAASQAPAAAKHARPTKM